MAENEVGESAQSGDTGSPPGTPGQLPADTPLMGTGATEGTLPTGPPPDPPAPTGPPSMGPPPSDSFGPTGPPSMGPPSGPPSFGGPPSAAGGSNRATMIAVVAGIVILALVAGLIGVLLTRKSSSTSGTTVPGSSNHSANGEIFLASATSAGPNPFTPNAATVSSVGKATTTTTTAPTTTQANVVTAIPGNTVGLYGGTLDYASCNPDQMITYMQANPAIGRAWAQVEGIDYSSLATYIHSLTSVILRADTRVTNHGYANGAAFEEQSVLQAGTAVLVDQYGVPRAKCYCGNPLTPPAPIPEPTYQGTPWPTFSPTQVVVVESSTVVITDITIIDTNTGDLFNRPIGTDGNGDTPYQPTGTPGSSTTTTAVSGSTTTTAAPASGDISNQALDLFNSRLAQCGGDQFLVNQQEQADGETSVDETANVSVSPSSNPGVYEVDVNMNESDGSTENTYSWLVSVPDNHITPQGSEAQSAAGACSALNS